MAVTLNDAEVAFYQGVIADPEGKSVSDLRYAYYLAALNGDLVSPGNVPTPPAVGAFCLSSVDGVLIWKSE